MTPMKIDYSNSKIILSSAFEKKAFTVGTQEYAALQAVRQVHPSFAIAIRQFKKNTKQEHYKGLTYDFMRNYIISAEGKDSAVLKELDDKLDISKCHSLGRRYPTIKSWFLERYPNVTEFGMTEEELSAWRDKLAKKKDDTEQPEESRQDVASVTVHKNAA